MVSQSRSLWPCSPASIDHSGRNSHGSFLRRQIRDHHSPRTDGSPFANFNCGDGDAASAHENSLGKGHLARKVTTRSHVREIPQ
jgi:hypothetical protein